MASPRPPAWKYAKDGHLRTRSFRYDLCMELIFEVREAEEGGYVARALGQAIFTEAETWQELRENVLEVTSLHFEDAPAKPKLIQLHFVKDELIRVEAA
jgi:predicted RNase H-like HicB family nuclease